MSDDVLIHPQALVESDRIGAGTRIWAFAHVMAGARLGERCLVGDHCFVEADVEIGDEVVLKNGVAVWAKVTIERNVFVGPYAVFTNDVAPRADPELRTGREGWKSTVVRHHASIGANATIVCGVELGPYSLVGAGAVVTRSVLAHEMVVGTPARRLGWACKCGGRLPEDSRTCDACGRAFEPSEDGPPCFSEDQPTTQRRET